MPISKHPHSMCITVRVDSAMLAELLAESGDSGLSKVLNEKAKRALAMLIDEAHKDKGDKNGLC